MGWVLFFYVVSYLIGIWVLYVVVKAAVRNGIGEADELRERRAFRRPASSDLGQRIAESRRKVPDADV